MKKHLWILGLFAALAIFMVSCSPEAGMTLLKEDDITDSWVKGTWSGTITTTTDDNEPEQKTVTSMSLTANDVKSYYKVKGGIDAGSIAKTSVDCKVYTNLARTRLNMVQTITASSELLGTSTKTVTRWELKKD